MTAWISKPWGRTRKVWSSSQHSCWMLETIAGGYSSLHYHRHAVNQFTVLSGALDVFTTDPVALTRTLDASNPEHIVSIGERHQFVVREPGIVLEFYWTRGEPLRDDDIVRLTENGIG